MELITRRTFHENLERKNMERENRDRKSEESSTLAKVTKVEGSHEILIVWQPETIFDIVRFFFYVSCPFGKLMIMVLQNFLSSFNSF